MKNYKNIIILIFCVLTSEFVLAGDESYFNPALNILGDTLKPCCVNPITGFFRNGYCDNNSLDNRKQLICSVITKKFLDFAKQQGKDLTTANLEHKFPGLKPGDNWCLPIAAWQEAHKSGYAPPIKAEATHEKALDSIDSELLEKYSVTDN
jgi:hypothetical protein